MDLKHKFYLKLPLFKFTIPVDHEKKLIIAKATSSENQHSKIKSVWIVLQIIQAWNAHYIYNLVI